MSEYLDTGPNTPGYWRLTIVPRGLHPMSEH